MVWYLGSKTEETLGVKLRWNMQTGCGYWELVREEDEDDDEEERSEG